MHYRKMIVAGGVSLVVGALAFVVVFSYLAANFDYPSVLEGSAADVLPRLRAGFSMLDELHFGKWLGWTGVAFALLFFVGAFRNVTSSVQPLADINNILLPVWMIVLGIAFVWCSRHRQPGSVPLA